MMNRPHIGWFGIVYGLWLIGGCHEPGTMHHVLYT